ncbi:hypothetical protein LXA43DRAFT_1157394 [Ganoderma leucocontextum]|nr:hypothetical protein LXA43DRAFT_1157394 [Ganoderma leucocontextum]
MAEEPYDTDIDFGFGDEANAFPSPSDTQNLPAFLVDILAVLNSGLPSLQVEEPTNAPTLPLVPTAPSASPAQSPSTFYYPFPTSSSSLWGAFGQDHLTTCVRPSDTIHIHGASSASLAPPAPSAQQHVPPALPRHSRAKRPREQTEDSGRPQQSSPQKRQRAAPSRTSAANVGHTSGTIDDPPPVLEVMYGAATREPGVPSIDWGILPGPGNDNIAGPSTVNVENMLCPRIPRKRTRNDEKSDGSATSNKRHKKVALADAPEVLNAPVAAHSGLRSVEHYGLLPAPAGDKALAARFPGLPELSPEFYKQLCDIASEIAQGLEQASGADGTSTYQDVPASSATTDPAGEDNNKRPSATTKGKGFRPRAPPKQPPKNHQHSPSNANPLPPADGSTQPETPKKPFGCPFAGADPTPCLQRFTRETDIKRHIRAKHLGCRVFCKHEKHGASPARIVREDGVFRHLAFSTCMGAAARAERVAERAREMGDAPDAGTRKWRQRVNRAVSGDYALFTMPCYYRDKAFWKAIVHLPGWTPHRLEKWFSSYGEVVRCSCEDCQKISDAELRGEVKIWIQDQTGETHPSPSASPIAGPSSAGAVAPVAGPSGYVDVAAIVDNVDCDDKLPPEEEEGVDEDLPIPPPVADPIAVVAQDFDAVAMADPPQDVGNVSADIYDIFSKLWEDMDLEGILCGSDGGQRDVDPTPDGESGA